MVELKSMVRWALVLAVPAMAIGCGPASEEETGGLTPVQDEVLTPDVSTDVGTAEQELTTYHWVSTGFTCPYKGPIDVSYECQRRGYDGGSSLRCNKWTLQAYCYVRT
jgi:hypothetical protein